MSNIAIFVFVFVSSLMLLPNLTNKHSYFGIALNSGIANLVNKFEQ